jgi:hypothetical protein
VKHLLELQLDAFGKEEFVEAAAHQPRVGAVIEAVSPVLAF